MKLYVSQNKKIYRIEGLVEVGTGIMFSNPFVSYNWKYWASVENRVFFCLNCKFSVWRII